MNIQRIWCLAVWKEGQKEVEDVVPHSWVQNSVLRWPPGVQADKYMKSLAKPANGWRSFELVKVKCKSVSKDECESYDFTSEVETCNEDDNENTQPVKRYQTKRCYKDFVTDMSKESENESGSSSRVTTQSQNACVDSSSSQKDDTPMPQPPKKVPVVRRPENPHTRSRSRSKDSDKRERLVFSLRDRAGSRRDRSPSRQTDNGQVKSPSRQTDTGQVRSPSRQTDNRRDRSSSRLTDNGRDRSRSIASDSRQNSFSSMSCNQNFSVKRSSHRDNRRDRSRSSNRDSRIDMLMSSRRDGRLESSRSSPRYSRRDRSESSHMDSRSNRSRSILNNSRRDRSRSSHRDSRLDWSRSRNRDSRQDSSRQSDSTSGKITCRKNMSRSRQNDGQNQLISRQKDSHTSRQDTSSSKSNSTDGFPMSEAKFQKKTVYLLLEIRTGVNDLLARQVDSTGAVAGPLPDLLTSKAETVDHFNSINDIFKNQQEQMRMIEHLKRIGGNDYKDNVQNILGRVMSNELMAKYNMKGNRGKLKYEATAMCKVIVESATKMFPVTEHDILQVIAAYLKYAPDRIGGGGRKKKAGAANDGTEDTNGAEN